MILRYPMEPTENLLKTIDLTLVAVRRQMQKIPKGVIVITWKDASVTIDVTEKGIDPSREP